MYFTIDSSDILLVVDVIIHRCIYLLLSDMYLACTGPNDSSFIIPLQKPIDLV